MSWNLGLTLNDLNRRINNLQSGSITNPLTKPLDMDDFGFTSTSSIQGNSLVFGGDNINATSTIQTNNPIIANSTPGEDALRVTNPGASGFPPNPIFKVDQSGNVSVKTTPITSALNFPKGELWGNLQCNKIIMGDTAGNNGTFAAFPFNQPYSNRIDGSGNVGIRLPTLGSPTAPLDVRGTIQCNNFRYTFPPSSNQGLQFEYGYPSTLIAQWDGSFNTVYSLIPNNPYTCNPNKQYVVLFDFQLFGFLNAPTPSTSQYPTIQIVLDNSTLNYTIFDLVPFMGQTPVTAPNVLYYFKQYTIPLGTTTMTIQLLRGNCGISMNYTVNIFSKN